MVKKLLGGATGRFLRSAVALGLASLVASLQDNPWYIASAPLLNAISKRLHDKYPGKWDWLPF